MIVPDANLLLYAYDEASPLHAPARVWWEERLNGAETVGLCACVVFAFVRIGTSARAFAQPLRIDEAVACVRAWCSLAHVTVLPFTAEDADCALSLLEKAGSGGNLTTDAQIAATALRLGARVETADTDFARFKVDWANPLD